MQVELSTRRRVLLLTYRRYIDADREWAVALREAREWFPEGSRPNRWTIGEPGSRMRRIYDRRERSVLQLQVALEKLKRAERRLEARSRGRRMMIACLPQA